MTRKANKKYAHFLSVMLSLSALTCPVYGMEWSEYFNPKDKPKVTIGLKIFSSFDSLTLEKTAPLVNKDWYVLAKHTRTRQIADRPWFLTRSQFEHGLKKTLDAEEDPLTPLLLSLSQASFFEDIFLKHRLKSRQGKKTFGGTTFLSPSSQKISCCYFDEIVPLLENAWSTKSPPPFYFEKLDALILKIESEKEKANTHETTLTELLHIYRDFRKKVSEFSSAKERSKYLTRSRIKSDVFPHWFMYEKKVADVFSIFPNGELILEKKMGSSWVKPYPEAAPKFYFKYSNFNDLLEYERSSSFHPGMEWGMYALSQILGGEILVPSTFLILNKNVKVMDYSDHLVRKKRELKNPATARSDQEQLEKEIEDFYWAPHFYGIQITPAVSGIPLISCLKENPNFLLEHKSYSQHILFSLIVKPIDYKGDNLLVNQFHEVIGIDNDMSLASPLIKTTGGTYTEFKNLLFCLPQMQSSVHKDVSTFFQNLHLESVLIEWLGALSEQNKRYEVLLRAQNVPPSFWEKIHLPLKLHRETVPQMLKDVRKLKSLFREASFKRENLTHQQLFAALFPATAAYYNTLVKKHGILKAWEIIYGGAAHQGNGLPFEKVLIPSVLSHENLPFLEKLIEAQFSDQEYRPEVGGYLERTLSPEEAAREIARSITTAILPPNEFNECLEKILKYFPNALEKYFDKNSLLKVLEGDHPSQPIIQFLIKSYGKDLVNDAGETLLHLCVKHKQISLLKKLLDEGVPYHQRDKFSLRAFDYALSQNQHEMIQCFINKGVARSMNASIGLKYYRDHKSNHQDIISSLLSQNMGFAWLTALEEILPPQGRGLPIRGATLGRRVIPETLLSQIYSKKGMIKKNTTGRHSVSYVSLGPHTLYFKEYPEIPGFEEAVASLGRLLFGDLTPYGDLFEIDGKPVWVSLGIPGESFQDTIKNKPLIWDKLDHEQLCTLTLLSMLTNPEDGKPDNLIVWNNKLYSIDNDHAFVQAVAKEQRNFWFQGPIVQVKTILYSMEHVHHPLPVSVRNTLLAFDIGKGLKDWLIGLKQKIQTFHLLFEDEGTRIKFFDKDNCYLGFPFDQKKIEPLYEKIIALKDLIYHNPEVTLFEILKELEKDLANRYNPILTAQRLSNFEEKVGQYYEKYSPQGQSETDFKEMFLKELQILKKSIGLKLFEAIPTNNNLWKMYIRFLFVDGEFYLRDKVGSLITLSTSKDLFLSQAIPWRIGLLSPFKNPNLDNAKLAQEALEALIERQASIDGLPLFEIRDDRVLEKKLKKTKFEEMGATQQIEIIKALKLRKLARISLVGSLLTDDLIRDYLNFAPLTYLDLRKCKKMTAETFSILSRSALALQFLNCAEIDIIRIGSHNHPLTFKSLKILNLDSCSNLTEIHLQAPFLKELIVEDCPKVGTLECKEVDKISLGGTPYWSRDKLQELLANHLTLKEVGCKKRFANVFIVKNMTSKTDLRDIIYSLRDKKYSESDVWVLSHFIPKESYLYLSYTKLNDVHIENIIPLLQGMPWLTKLVLQGNKIGEKGAASIGQYMTQLTSLDLSENQIGDQGAEAIAQSMTNLTELNLSWNQIGDKGAEAMAQSMTNLISLDLSWNQIGDKGAEAISQYLTQLKELNLWKNQIGDKGAASIFQYMTNLISLDLYDNQIGDKGAEAMAHSMTNLRMLYLSKNQIGDKGAEAIARSVTNLTKLNLSENQIGDKGAEAIARSVTNLTKLNLSENQIGDKGAASIAQSLTNLRELNLSSNQIGEKGAASIAQYMTQLTWLNLEKNQIGDKGAASIAQSMTQLILLFLSSNKIGDRGAEAIVQYMTQLAELKLNSNQIGDKGAEAIAQSMTNLKELSLEDNQIGDKGAASIGQHMTNLTKLDLESNQIGDKGAEAIAQSLTNLTWLNLNGNKIKNQDLLKLPSKRKQTPLSHTRPEQREAPLNINSHVTSLEALNHANTEIKSPLTDLQTLNLWGKK